MAHPRSAGRRTDKTWVAIGDHENAQDLAGQSQFGTTNFQFLETGTIMRLRGRVGVVLDTGGVNESAIIMCGLFVTTLDDIAGGNAPEMLTQTADEASWIWQGSLFVSSGDEAAVITDRLTATIEIDSKAMRRVKSNHALAFVFQSPGAITNDQTGLFNLSWFVHMLFGA